MSAQRGSSSRVSYAPVTPPTYPVYVVPDVYGGPLGVNAQCPGAPRWETIPLPDMEAYGLTTPPSSPPQFHAALPAPAGPQQQLRSAPVNAVPYRGSESQGSLFPGEEYDDDDDESSPYVPSYTPRAAPGGPTANNLWLSRSHGHQSSWMPPPASHIHVSQSQGLAMDLTDSRNAQFQWGQQSSSRWGYAPAVGPASRKRTSVRDIDDDEAAANGVARDTPRQRPRWRER